MGIHGYPWGRRRLILSAMLPATWWSSSSFSTRPVPVRNAARPWSPSSAARRQRSNSRVSFKKSMRFTLETEPEQAVDVHWMHLLHDLSISCISIYISLYLFISILKRAYVWMYVCVLYGGRILSIILDSIQTVCSIQRCSSYAIQTICLSCLLLSCRRGTSRRVVGYRVALCSLLSFVVYLSFYPSICFSIRLSVYLSISLSVYLSICLSACLSACLPACLSVPPSIHPSRQPSIHPSFLCAGNSLYFVYLCVNL